MYVLRTLLYFIVSQSKRKEDSPLFVSIARYHSVDDPSRWQSFGSHLFSSDGMG